MVYTGVVHGFMIWKLHVEGVVGSGPGVELAGLERRVYVAQRLRHSKTHGTTSCLG